MNRLIIVGAGPIGLHAALRATSSGFSVTVLERAEIGAAVRKWGHVRLFTPFSMNSTAAGRKIAAACGRLPNEDALLTGNEYLESYLSRLAASTPLVRNIQTYREVTAVSRQTYGKSHAPGRLERSNSPFRLLVCGPDNSEFIMESDVLIDCTGFMTRHRFIGIGGIPCPGERSCLTADDYGIAAPQLSSDHLQDVVVVGSGYSAATSVGLLQGLDRRISWITRGNREVPVPPVADDKLFERRMLTQRVNELARSPESGVRWLPGVQIESIEQTRNGFSLSVSSMDGWQEILVCDRLIANPGFRPDSRPFEELQIHRCYATEGPIKLAAHLISETSDDCLSQTVPGADLLGNPEPNFYILGAASYGRDSRFLLKNGLEQVEQLFDKMICPMEAST